MAHVTEQSYGHDSFLNKLSTAEFLIDNFLFKLFIVCVIGQKKEIGTNIHLQIHYLLIYF